MGEVKLSNKIYEEARDCEKIVDILVTSNNFPEHKHLVHAKIKCMFKDDMSGHGWNKFGKVLKVNDLYWSLLGFDLIIVVNKKIWDKLERSEKITLMMHLLSKVKVYYKYEGKNKKSLSAPADGKVANFDITYSGRINYAIIPPDVEEFDSVAKKVGKSYEILKEISMSIEE